ncbi:hypothetical protein HNY73_018014 [Argiope bruennichi]|uniref:Uncharacterized protein n=1 Tax=Argiope bruennichi TaxID=94029 RepID=A0A8T0ECY7_ARGBR|nr:hypothetical protein HNY73_018014 [Argiope bruennichi]
MSREINYRIGTLRKTSFVCHVEGLPSGNGEWTGATSLAPCVRTHPQVTRRGHSNGLRCTGRLSSSSR